MSGHSRALFSTTHLVTYLPPPFAYSDQAPLLASRSLTVPDIETQVLHAIAWKYSGRLPIFVLIYRYLYQDWYIGNRCFKGIFSFQIMVLFFLLILILLIERWNIYIIFLLEMFLSFHWDNFFLNREKCSSRHFIYGVSFYEIFVNLISFLYLDFFSVFLIIDLFC